MKPGEKVVSAVNFEGKVLIFGEWGTVLELTHDPANSRLLIREVIG